MTRTDVSINVMAELENNGTFFSTTEVNEATQDAYDEVALLAGTIEMQAEISLIANTGYYNLRSLLTNFYSIIGIFNEQDQKWLTSSSPLKLDAMRLDWELMTGSPKWFFMASLERVCIVPRPTASIGTLTILFKACAPTLSDSTSLIVPKETESILEEYDLMQLHEQAREWHKAQKYEQSYEELLKQTKRFMSRRASPDRMYQLCQSGQIR